MQYYWQFFSKHKLLATNVVNIIVNRLKPAHTPPTLVIKRLFLALEKNPVKKRFTFFFIEQIVIACNILGPDSPKLTAAVNIGATNLG
jgi:hypothetical protein